MEYPIINYGFLAIFAILLTSSYIKESVQEIVYGKARYDRFIDTAEIARLSTPPTNGPSSFWNAVHLREKDAQTKLLAVEHQCEGDFPVLAYLQDVLNVSDEALQGLSQQHKSVQPQRHVRLESFRKEEIPLEEREFAFRSASSRGEYAKVTSGDVTEELQNGVVSFQRLGVDFRLYVFTYKDSLNPSPLKYYVLAWTPSNQRSMRAGHDLIADVYRWGSMLMKEMLAFNGMTGGWRKDKSLYASVQSSQTSDLILPPRTLDQLERDTMTFFQSETLYRKNGLAWKRGILLLGPPGNGKTGVIKVLAKRLSDERSIPTLYVETAKTLYGSESGITSIFRKARKEAPCLLVLEDIETLVSGETRTMMLNQLDGLEANDGILIVATANKVEQLDAAILQRPSRFDAKYLFNLHNADLRKRFCEHWLRERLGASMFVFDDERITSIDALAHFLSIQTELWSFAFMKELFVSLLLMQASNTQTAQSQNQPEVPIMPIKVSDVLSQLAALQVQVTPALEQQCWVDE